MSSLWVASLNARGLSKPEKFQRLVYLIKDCDVLCLQETFWNQEVVEALKKFWDGDIYFNNYQSKKKELRY